MTSKKLFYKSRMLVVIADIFNNWLTPWKLKHKGWSTLLKTAQWSSQQQQALLTHSFYCNRKCSCCRGMKDLIHFQGTGKRKDQRPSFPPTAQLQKGLLLLSLSFCPSKSLIAVVGCVKISRVIDFVDDGLTYCYRYVFRRYWVKTTKFNTWN